ncbi:MAG: exodeoxyribonuclease III [Pseudomonadota bacterium]
MKIASWNVNSLKVRLPHVLDWLTQQQPDALGLQELKMDTPVFPHAAFEAIGYHCAVMGQKTYNGVAWLVKNESHERVFSQEEIGFEGWIDPQARAIGIQLNGITLMDWYVPNGQAVGSEKYLYKLEWLNAAQQHIKNTLAKNDKLIIVGDFNIAPADADVYDPVAWGEGILCSPPERAAFQSLLACGLHDSFRLFEQPEKSYTWWDYRQGGFRRNQGLRIDHILISESLKASALRCWIDPSPRALERPSDHTPIILELS